MSGFQSFGNFYLLLVTRRNQPVAPATKKLTKEITDI